MIKPGFDQGDNGFNYDAIKHVESLYPEKFEGKHQLYFEKCLTMIGVIEKERAKRREKSRA